jgi:hypothetical protein
VEADEAGGARNQNGHAGRQAFFFEKKKQKTFARSAP